MKTISKLSFIGAAVITTMILTINMSFAAASSTSSDSVSKEQTMPLATGAQARLIQDFQNENLNVQFRYENDKLVGIRLMNMGTQPIRLQLLQDNYILGSKDYVVINPPNVEVLQIYKSPYVAPLTTVDFLLPNRFGKQDVFVMPEGLNDAEVTK